MGSINAGGGESRLEAEPSLRLLLFALLFCADDATLSGWAAEVAGSFSVGSFFPGGVVTELQRESAPPQVPPQVEVKLSCEGETAVEAFFCREDAARVDGVDLELLNFGVEVENLGEVPNLSLETLATSLEVLEGPRTMKR